MFEFFCLRCVKTGNDFSCLYITKFLWSKHYYSYWNLIIHLPTTAPVPMSGTSFYWFDMRHTILEWKRVQSTELSTRSDHIIMWYAQWNQRNKLTRSQYNKFNAYLEGCSYISHTYPHIYKDIKDHICSSLSLNTYVREYFFFSFSKGPFWESEYS